MGSALGKLIGLDGPEKPEVDPNVEKRLADQEAAEEAREKAIREEESARRRNRRAGQTGGRSLLFEGFGGVKAKPGSAENLGGN